MFVSNIVFLIIFLVSIFIFSKEMSRIRYNISLGNDINRYGNKKQRWVQMFKVAFGQTKMVARPIAGLLHVIIYSGFLIINIELIEIIIDGIFGTHRILSFLGIVYNFLIASFEILAFLVLIVCIIFLTRRNIIKIKRFISSEMKGWPKLDANLILIFEIFLMSAFILMQASDLALQNINYPHYIKAGSFPVSKFLLPLFQDLNPEKIYFFERFFWWFHIIGIFLFLNYLPYSKHLHIIFAFPNTYYSNLNPKGQFENMESVKQEVLAMINPNNQNPPSSDDIKFGAKDVNDLNWVQLMNSYSCTECGRCTSECPANFTGKKLSPRKIMMDTRDRLEEFSKNISLGKSDNKSLLGDYISKEEIWACTSCNACTQACPINIDPLSIILDLRRYCVMEESSAPSELNMMFNNIENNGAPWQFASSDRLNWKE